mmetsp:Transcript_48449/g.35658  ORF Transcript_48449/g.35658 Transcript_48449/m.35658 type:complete len:98 (-) Transcript_48449:657-950(-)|eukprot:CAMPEP_0202959366 /NCGR_PEP_ID=MMETSP1396-20130829/3565_1 /ASSEMBLY_ACC=CAM_ASM_000872 /TAXON_ID= /ORGANISM="Pseudokeronopsis sp., Strain Brazil" /LENGTH=97 /DNA_ID=CAMNT_0049677885 /DNA_START=296 /DNA_END=589 /DNA_ORIENTATION=-
MIGDNQVYEPSFISLSAKKDQRRISIDEKCPVLGKAAFGKERMDTLKKSNAYLKYAKNGYNLLLTEGDSSHSKRDRSFLNSKEIFRNDYSNSLIQDN